MGAALAVLGGIIVGLLGLLGFQRWRSDRASRQHAVDVAVEREHRRRAESEADLVRVETETEAEIRATRDSDIDAVDRETARHDLADFLTARIRGVRDSGGSDP